MEQLKDILKQTLFKVGLSQIRELSLITENWERVVGVEAAAFCRPLKIKNSVLIVEVVSPVWAHRLTLEKIKLKQELSTVCKLKDIRFQLARS